MKYLLVGMLLVNSSVCIAAATTAITSETVMAHIKVVGAKQALVDYFAKPQWSAIKKGVTSGGDGWLRVYTSLKPVADGEAGEDLDEAIFEALPSRPFRILPLLEDNGRYTVQQLCSFTFEAKAPDEGINTYLHRLEQSLAKANSPRERVMAGDCRKGIQATRRALKGNLQSS